MIIPYNGLINVVVTAADCFKVSETLLINRTNDSNYE